LFADPATRFYPIIDTAACASRGFEPREAAAACFRAGVRMLQLRVKAGSSAVFLALADDLIAAAEASRATVVVNDRADIAAMSGAGGVHLGQQDLPPSLVRPMLGAKVVGLSTHGRVQAEQAVLSGADYLAVGPIYETGTKVTGYHARGLELVRYAATLGRPVVAIGGITLDRARAVIDAGASAVAVISDLLVTGDPQRRADEYLRALA
jgi:thiamine-phosphate pyrophosphorylase